MAVKDLVVTLRSFFPKNILGVALHKQTINLMNQIYCSLLGGTLQFTSEEVKC